jgi:ABC-2 type transport system ATP-binding protein
MIIEIEGLSKQYGSLRALSNIHLRIESGGIVGLLGPNGAGKTTLVETLEGLRIPSSGTVRVLGLDPTRQARALRDRIGVQLQSTAIPTELTPIETLRLFGSFFTKSLQPMEVLTRVGLAEKAKFRNCTMSGGERQRLAIAMALINDPELVILDEPTSGLDPGIRREVHVQIAALRAANRTVLLTTHYLEEAEKLCDRVIVLRHGEVVADASPQDLLAQSGGTRTLFIALGGQFDPAPLLQAAAKSIGTDGDSFRYAASDARSAILALAELLRNKDVRLLDLHTEGPNLENVYHTLMGDSTPETGFNT